MKAKEQSEIERLNSDAAEHERNAGIIRGSMSSTPSPDDFQQAESMQRELDRAKDKRALAQHIINERVNQLTQFFQQQTDCTVSHEWKIDIQCHRFYFQKDKEKDWRYILDLYQGDVEEHDLSQIIQDLTAAKWIQVLEGPSGKRVPRFKEGTFSNVAAFQEWPQKARH